MTDPAAERWATCPKCGTTRQGEPACPSCGLAVDRMATFAEERDGAVPQPVRAAWRRVDEGWDDPARHDELLRLVAIHNCYAWTAGRYRDASRSRKDDTIAGRQLERLRRAAEVTLLATATVRRDPGTPPYRATATILVMMIIAIIVGLLYAMITRARGATDDGEPPPNRPQLQQVR